jgi:ubiquinone/menaquinone biosynthesis C-methylase UbiE
MSLPPRESYGARDAYQDAEAARHYGEAAGTGGSGPLGRYRRALERRAVALLAADIPVGATVLDCPCGNGRWLEALAGRAGRIVGLDLSPAMLGQARGRAETLGISSAFLAGEVEHLPLADASVDITFSFALTKHLPQTVQRRALAEFGRVSRLGVICSFAVFGPVSRILWRRRALVESHPVSRAELDAMAREAGLRVTRLARCSTPVGVEHLARLERVG